MSKMKRQRYSAEFKRKVALEAIKGELTIAQLAAKHGVHQTLINGWKKQAVAARLAARDETRTNLILAARPFEGWEPPHPRGEQGCTLQDR